MKAELSAAQRYLRAIHWLRAAVYYVDDEGERRSSKMTFFHTQGWGDREVMAEVQRRQPTWREIELGLQSSFTPARDAVVPTRDLKLEAEILA